MTRTAIVRARSIADLRAAARAASLAGSSLHELGTDESQAHAREICAAAVMMREWAAHLASEGKA